MSNIYPVTAEFTEMSNGTLIKYANGYAEFISNVIELTGLNFKEAGNSYRCDLGVSLPFGITFKKVPNIQFSVVSNAVIPSRIAISVSQVSKVCFYSNIATTDSKASVMFRAFGRWK